MSQILTYNSCVPTYTHTRTSAMGNGPLSIFVEFVGYITEFMTAAELRLPGVGIHGEILKVL